MSIQLKPALDVLSAAVAILLFLIGWFCIATRHNIIKQVIGLKVMLQGVTLSLILAGHHQGDLRVVEPMVISALIIETVVIGVALALIVNVFQHYPSGDVDHLDRLQG